MLLAYLLSSGITSGALYALVAVGLVICYRTTSHINFSHGELFMVGGFIAFSLHVLWGVPYIPSLLIAVVAGGAIGLMTDRAVYRTLINAPPIAMVVATVAFSFVLKGIGRFLWGGQGEFVPFPPIADPAPVEAWGIAVFPQQLVVLAGALFCMALLTLFFRFTRAGKTMQATAESPRAAYLVGIRVERVYASTWAVSAALATVAAVLMAPLTQLTPDIGLGLLLKAFAATILGGLGNMPGAIVGGFLVGICESLAGGYVASSAQEVAAFVIIMIMLLVRPTGLFGERGRREV
ncbi:MAG: branched-chain amino acid ABC transporter permease [Alphaproteobacteria bacterium]|nr:branched-chain amino acid ABC transporter permease [Alphaproteobacteria bacterium]